MHTSAGMKFANFGIIARWLIGDQPMFAKLISLQPFCHNKTLIATIICKILERLAVKITKLSVNAKIYSKQKTP